MQLRQWWAESAPPGWNRVKVSENLDATSVAPVAPVDTSLQFLEYLRTLRQPTGQSQENFNFGLLKL